MHGGAQGWRGVKEIKFEEYGSLVPVRSGSGFVFQSSSKGNVILKHDLNTTTELLPFCSINQYIFVWSVVKNTFRFQKEQDDDLEPFFCVLLYPLRVSS